MHVTRSGPRADRRARGYRRSGPPLGARLRDDSRVTHQLGVTISPPRVRHSREVQSHQQALLRGPVEPEQYTAVTFGSACRAHGITQSNSRKGSPHDNAAKESFFASLEKERLRRRTFATHEQARSSVFQYIEEFYNRRRLHSTLGYRSPDEAERDHHLTLLAPPAA